MEKDRQNLIVIVSFPLLGLLLSSQTVENKVFPFLNIYRDAPREPKFRQSPPPGTQPTRQRDGDNLAKRGNPQEARRGRQERRETRINKKAGNQEIL